MAYRPPDTTARILHRLKIARGHLDKVISMVEDDGYCIDIIHQIGAVDKALIHTSHVILQNHLNTCVADAIKKGKKDEVIDEVMEVFKKQRI